MIRHAVPQLLMLLLSPLASLAGLAAATEPEVPVFGMDTSIYQLLGRLEPLLHFDEYGGSTAIDGDWLWVASARRALLFERSSSSTQWQPLRIFNRPGSRQADARFGEAVALQGAES